MQALARRVGQLVLHPQAAWSAIAAEPAVPRRDFGRVAVPLALLGAGATAAGEVLTALIGRDPLLKGAIVGLGVYPALRLSTVALLGGVGGALGRSFGIALPNGRAHQLAVWSTAPVLAAGLFNVLPLGMSFAWFLAGSIFGAYTYFFGTAVFSDAHRERRLAMTAVAFATFFVANTLIEIPLRLILKYAL